MRELNRDSNEAVDHSPVPNAMEFALRQAMEQSEKDDGGEKKSKRRRSRKDPLEEIFSRTLENYEEEE